MKWKLISCEAVACCRRRRWVVNSYCIIKKTGPEWPNRPGTPSPPNALTTSVLFKIILSFETFAADFAAEGELGTFVGPLVDHQIVRLRKPALAIFAYKFTFSAHFPAKLAATNVVVDLHNREHVAGFLSPPLLLLS